MIYAPLSSTVFWLRLDLHFIFGLKKLLHMSDPLVLVNPNGLDTKGCIIQEFLWYYVHIDTFGYG
ncbi:hypothetical protein A0J61_01286 [Choanephora cucurbitarum]|uniref:Uncharacterized protein n=1 Tax=Choanephora cucurbitarum TaxID=101091 RepID=A0A1C7NT16_9FUNG|nr:hypothetical protein A0J61_01286 [Choanephora cucurbitarum]